MHFGLCQLALSQAVSGHSWEDSRGWVLFMVSFLEGAGRTYMGIEAVTVADLRARKRLLACSIYWYRCSPKMSLERVQYPF